MMGQSNYRWPIIILFKIKVKSKADSETRLIIYVCTDETYFFACCFLCFVQAGSAAEMRIRRLNPPVRLFKPK